VEEGGAAARALRDGEGATVASGGARVGYAGGLMDEQKPPEHDVRAELLRREALRIELSQRAARPPEDYRGMKRSAKASSGVGQILTLLVVILLGLVVLKLASGKLGL
jgi:hypothetical protein